MAKGKVYLVGAGPGDADLLTIKAEKLIRSADAIVFDKNVENVILDMSKASATLVGVEVNSANDVKMQAEINEILVNIASEHETIVRLKGGDPFAFGTGGTELENLYASGIPFEVVPGISTSIAVPAYAGVPLTHKDYSSSFHIITANVKSQENLNMDFESFAGLDGTLLFMMDISNIGKIANGLLKHGKSKDTTCVVIENGTRSNQRKFISTISEIESVVMANNVGAPAVILVGEVANLSKKLDWFSHKPLKNIKILATQRVKNASRLVPILKENGAGITYCPTVQSTSTIKQSLDLSKYTTIAFSSMQGVDSFFECIVNQNLDARALFGKKIACVGSQTAKALSAKGIKSDYIPEIFSGKSMAEGMISNGMLKNEDTLLLVRPSDGTDEILNILNANKIKYDDIPFYKTEYLSQKFIEDISEYDFITFTSKSVVESFAKSQAHLDFANSTAICMGDQTAETARKYGFIVVESQDQSIGGMVNLIIKLATEKKKTQ